MKPTLVKMIKIYKPKRTDWLGFKITKKNPYSYHHILKAVYGDYSDLDEEYSLHNGAILSKKGQNYIHAFETTDLAKYNELNRILRELNETEKPPTEEHWEKIKKAKGEV